MKIRNVTAATKVELQMTPMIDIVFQLLVFFIMTFKIVAQEGDFNIKMPLAAPSETMPDLDTLPPMKLRLTADGAGNLASMQLGENAFRDFAVLRDYIIGVIGTDAPGALREAAEVELDSDYDLRYEYVIAAITAISGYTTPDGQVVKLIENIKFAPPRER
jgi:biopolymer transport protein ExbD